MEGFRMTADGRNKTCSYGETWFDYRNETILMAVFGNIELSKSWCRSHNKSFSNQNRFHMCKVSSWELFGLEIKPVVAEIQVFEQRQAALKKLKTNSYNYIHCYTSQQIYKFPFSSSGKSETFATFLNNVEKETVRFGYFAKEIDLSEKNPNNTKH